MIMLRRILAIAFLCVVSMIGAARAQDLVVPLPSGCGTGNFLSGTAYLTINLQGQLCINGVTVSSSYTPSAPTIANAGKLAAGATAQNLFTAGEVAHGCVITNPASAVDEGIGTAEEIWVNFTGTATLSPNTAPNTTSIPIAIGQSIPCPGGLTTAVSWIATTIGHFIAAYKF
jgi:hypothetical protein